MEHFLVELFLRGTLLCLLTAAVLLLLRRAAAAAYRHLLCVLALCGLLALPLAQRLLPPLPVLQPQSPVTPNRGTLPTEAADRPAGGRSILEMPSLPETPQHRRVFRTDPTAFLPQESAPTTPLLAPVERVSRPKHVRTATAALLCVIWGLGAATLLLRLSVALLRLRRLEAESRKAMLGNVPIRVGERIATPLTWGIRRQVILLPAALLSGDPAVCETALRHEQAHIDRGDWLWNLLAELVCALCWFQPGVWWLRRRMRLESERACDDRVLLSGIDGPDYAAHLLQILKSARTGERASASELASAMAHSGSMEARMRHILDTATPRCAQTKWLAVSASLALALLSCTALRLSARPADAKTPVDPDATILKSRRSILPSRPSHLPLPNADSGMPYTANLPLPVLTPDVTLPIVSPQQTSLPNSPPATEIPRPNSEASVGSVVWGKTVDGMQPGFLRNTSGSPTDRRARFHSKVTYQVLVRNTTRQERFVEVQCQDFLGMAPYLIPNDDIRQALGGGKIPDSYRALALDDGRAVFPAYPVKLAPGEAVVLPEVLTLYVGDADKQNSPRIEKVKPGKNWVVQPIAVRSLTPEEAAEALAGEQKIKLTLLSRAGKSSVRFTTWRAMGSEGKRLYAKIFLEIGTPDAETPPTVKTVAGSGKGGGLPLGAPTIPDGSAVQPAPASFQGAPPAATTPVPGRIPPLGHVLWGEAVDGLQPGFLLKAPGLADTKRLPLNSEATYQVLVRNTSHQERGVEVQCQDFRDMDPCWIPDADLRNALSGSALPNEYRVSGVSDLRLAFLGSVVRLAPGEAVLLPEVLHLYLGDADYQHSPRIEQVKPGKNWIVQPIMVRALTSDETAEDLASITSPYGNGAQLTILTRDGNTVRRLGARRGIRHDSLKVYAKFPLTVNYRRLKAERLVLPWKRALPGRTVGQLTG